MFNVESTPPFKEQVKELLSKHRAIESDIAWLSGRLCQAPGAIGDRVTQIKAALPVFKCRCKDSCCKLSSREGWRLYYAIQKEMKTVFLLFLIHKHEQENPGKNFLEQKITRAFAGRTGDKKT